MLLRLELTCQLGVRVGGRGCVPVCVSVRPLTVRPPILFLCLQLMCERQAGLEGVVHHLKRITRAFANTARAAIARAANTARAASTGRAITARAAIARATNTARAASTGRAITARAATARY